MSKQALSEFVAGWRKEYANTASALPLFNTAWVARLTLAQREFLARALYHVRGHFYPFLWFSASLAPSLKYRRIVLANFKDEFGITAPPSHEQLYARFAEEMGVPNIFDEVVSERTYFSFIREFVKDQLDLIVTKADDWDFVWSAYVAIEALDNVDYQHLWQMATGLCISDTGLEFFRVHVAVRHYEVAHPLLRPIWRQNPEKVEGAFAGIARLQLDVWQELSQRVFAHR